MPIRLLLRRLPPLLLVLGLAAALGGCVAYPDGGYYGYGYPYGYPAGPTVGFGWGGWGGGWGGHHGDWGDHDGGGGWHGHDGGGWHH